MTILDEIAARPHVGPTRQQRAVMLRHRPRCRSFVFSESASRLVGRFCAEVGDLIVDNRQFAIPRYNATYIEFNGYAFFEQFNKDRVSNLPAVDDRFGYFIVDQTVWVLSANDTGGASGGLGWQWRRPGEVWHTPVDFNQWPIVDLTKPVGGTVVMGSGKEYQGHKWLIGSLALGTTIEKIKSEAQLNEIVDEVIPVWRYAPEYGAGLSTDAMHRLMQSTAGDMRNLWGGLLWINRHRRTVISDIPATSQIKKGKRIAYAAHHIVDIDLGRCRTVRRAFETGAERLSPRRHEVGGYFNHRNLIPGCSHQWPLMPDEKGRWECAACGGIRWWVTDYMRGDATRGFVTKEYEVTTEIDHV